ncbi:MAG: hypothetical protein A2268_06250 [Candidatus Raymondbacteria bacterium RifOxyA12_full_50_37]|uniref:Secretion system C-terminal sorting domain-containing protein n=1 Tax=Candidatus Raymondbacteria bacterium RIFOXYD12_FULL_49_13 TaxID=1817890 RepID=A0A1F7FKP3_UNCRA|nr:MAG: hypothetical protein A2268_06250 [Candidatus Raymondbacteria bacterium RifOxyA12_full_50_37]OGJ94570.1 MAG: hypothetical protein A2248_15180 [Candidatus Raymondbacteria bacterium RIFOXYA2_FULL_49_16]OGK05668.1 MAG: hypothetical protein A2487_14270 [Candidatus Raymondbacteria bacterium RifOxyC12_full_50_8]OGK07046.1 MAG: hypothetical protein A2519_13820 [Candidatus Raymondbacteria bacterium RIFOXYD12_FULL_49_13]OGP45519.1 MAG: hypothetical protein A2324_15260 [Candidatus Raymondbacteria 
MPVLIFLLLLVMNMPAQVAYDAQFVRCVIPETLTTDEIFPAVICMRNTGDSAWDITNTLLHSQNPYKNYTWGTYFILQHHGPMLAPGDTFDFTSHFRAPHSPGKFPFSWQCYNNNSRQLYGEIVPAESITVTQRIEQPPPPPPHQDSLLDSSDFEYLGSFKLPAISGHDNTFNRTGCALRIMPDSTRHLFLETGYPNSIYEVEIPQQFVKMTNNDGSVLNAALLVKEWGPVTWSNPGSGDQDPLDANGGFWWDDSAQTLYWTIFNSYYTGSGFPMLAASRLANDSVTNLKYWYLPMPSLVAWKGYWRGVTNIPKAFADTYTGGRDIGLGFGGMYSIGQTASRGPAIAAIQKPDISKDTVDLVEMLRYNTYTTPSEAAVRNGNYFGTGDDGGWWYYQPPNPWDGRFAYNSSCAAGVFIDLPDKHGYVAFATHLTGRIAYDWGGQVVDAHYEDDWYFYDLKDLGAAALGQIGPGTIQPTSFVAFNWPTPFENTTNRSVTGACFDEQTRTMYVYMPGSIDDVAYYRSPVIHAYYVKKDSVTAAESAVAVIAGPIFSVSPNPFNPATRIRIQEPSGYAQSKQEARSKNSEIRIFDIHGKLVQKLATDYLLLASGITWDASNQPSGLYIIRVQVGGKTLVKQALLLK